MGRASYFLGHDPVMVTVLHGLRGRVVSCSFETASQLLSVTHAIEVENGELARRGELAGWRGVVRGSHPSRKNKDAARVGHPGIIAGRDLKKSNSFDSVGRAYTRPTCSG